jgi:tetratricopeptide (TPR) repeat protein
MTHAHHDCKDVPAAEDAAIAEQAMAERDLPHAALHVCRALSESPLEPRYLALLERLYDEGRAGEADPLRLVPTEHGTSFAIYAGRAWMLARLGKLTEAVSLIFQVVDVQPTVPYLAWVADWLKDDAAARGVDADGVSRFVGAWVLHRREVDDDPAGRPAVRAGLPVVVRLAETHPASLDLRYWTVAARRKLRQLDEALADATALYAEHPAGRSALAVAMVKRERGDVDGAAVAFRQALGHEPRNVGVMLDLGDLLAGHERVDEGIAAYEQALSVEPDNAWARPSILYFRAVHHGDEDAAEKLRLMTFNEPNNRRATHLAERLPPAKATGKAKRSSKARKGKKG